MHFLWLGFAAYFAVLAVYAFAKLLPQERQLNRECKRDAERWNDPVFLTFQVNTKVTYAFAVVCVVVTVIYVALFAIEFGG